VAACRSILAARRLSRIGPSVRSPMAWSSARLTADGWRERDVHGLAAFADDAEDAVTVFLAEIGDVGSAGFEDARA
jgi:hypothetical protein